MSREALSTPEPADKGFNLVGHLTTRMGLGRAARMTLELIELNQWPVAITDVHFRGLTRIPLASSAAVGDLDALPHSATLLHLNPEQLVDGLLLWRPELLGNLATRYLATVPYWELPDLPPYWIQLFRGMDEVLAPTRFIEANLRRALGDTPEGPRITHFMQAVRPPEGVRPDRARWFGERAGTTVFFASFDVVSDPMRKNAEGVVDAFLAAAENRDDLTLALKAGYATSADSSGPYRRLVERVSSDARVLLIEETLSDSDMWSLLASADAYVSLHRAEGLGLGMMESMSLGTPVIGTNWSGNTDFMTEEDSILVPYELVPVQAHQVPLYREFNGRSSWAEPDWHFAARAMRELADSSELCARLGGAARESAQRRWSEYQRADALRAALDASVDADLASGARMARVAELEDDLRQRRHGQKQARKASKSLLERAKGTAVKGLRAAGLKPPAPAHEAGPGPLDVVDPYDAHEGEGT